jgi:hypothetical protein
MSGQRVFMPDFKITLQSDMLQVIAQMIKGKLSGLWELLVDE